MPQSLAFIGTDSFASCASLKSIQWRPSTLEPQLSPAPLVSIGVRAFAYSEALVSLAELLRCSASSLLTIQGSAFSGCASLTFLDLEEFTSLQAVSDSSFSFCASLQTIRLPKTLLYIRRWAFADCKALTAIRLPKSVQLIEDYAFYGCDSAETLEFPATITRIGRNAFNKCSSLSIIQLSGASTTSATAWVRCLWLLGRRNRPNIFVRAGMLRHLRGRTAVFSFLRTQVQELVELRTRQSA